MCSLFSTVAFKKAEGTDISEGIDIDIYWLGRIKYESVCHYDHLSHRNELAVEE